MKLKAILDDELINWTEVKKGGTYECDENMYNYLLKAYWNHREPVEETEEVEEKEVKKTTKWKKK